MKTKRFKKFFAAVLSLSMLMNTISVTSLACSDEIYSCGKEIHVHTEQCYAANTATPSSPTEVTTATGSSASASNLICKKDVHKAHTYECLSYEAKAEVDAVSELVENVPTVDEMNSYVTYWKDTYGRDETYKEDYTYEEFMVEHFSYTEEAYNAYEELDDELKQYVEDADKLEAVAKMYGFSWDEFLDYSEKFTTGEGEYIYQLADMAYQVPPHRNAANRAICTFMMVDTSEYGGKVWEPDGAYNPATSNYFVTYCCDAGTGTSSKYYRRINLESATYFDENDAAKLRAVATKMYPFISADDMRDDMEAWFANNGYENIDVDDIETAEMTAAGQMTVWGIANDDGTLSENYWNPIRSSKRRGEGESYYPFVTAYNPHVNAWGINFRPSYPSAVSRIEAVMAYLASLEPQEPEADEIVIDNVKITSMDPILNAEGTSYTIVLKVELNGSGSSSADDIKITATNGAVVEEIEVEYGQTEYDLLLTVNPGDEVSVTVSGTQVLPKSAYFYESEGGRKGSQNMIGVAMGETPIAAYSEVIEVPDYDEETVTGTLNLQKTDETGEILTGAEFDLLYNGTTVDTFTVNENGQLTINGLIAGTSYQLEETKAPNGYSNMKDKISFTVEDDGSIEFAELGNNAENLVTVGENQLTVKNMPNTSVTVNKVWLDDSEDVRPSSICVQLLKNGEEEGEAVTISSDVDWTYTWSDLDCYAEWTVCEVEVPENYTVVVDGEDNHYTITNTYHEPDTTDPTQPSETQPSETKPNETQPSETQPSEIQSSESQPSESQPTETQPSNSERDDDEPDRVSSRVLGASDEKSTEAETEGFTGAVLGAFDTFEILDDLVPLGVLPATGDVSLIWMALGVLSALGLVGTSMIERKKRK